MSVVRAIAGLGIAAAVLAPLSVLSTAPMRMDTRGDPVLRVSIGARPERIETCREQTDEELAKVAPQMRQRVVCEGTTARYRFTVWLADSLLDSATVRGGGLRHDRRLYVFREYALRAGRNALRVRLDRIDTVQTATDTAGAAADLTVNSRDERERAERSRRLAGAVPSSLELAIAPMLESRQVILVTYDQNGRRLAATTRNPD